MGGSASVEEKKDAMSEHEKLKHLKESPIPLVCNEAELEQLAKLAKPKVLADGDGIGTEKDDLCIVCSGKLKVSFQSKADGKRGSRRASDAIEISKDDERILCEKEQGDVFSMGDVNSACAVGAATMLVVTAAQLANFTTSNGSFGAALNSLVKKDITHRLRQIPIFRELSASTIVKFARECHYETYEKNEDVFAEGEQGDNMYVILHGSVEVHTTSKKVADSIEEGALLNAIKDDDGKAIQRRGSILLANMGPGTFFGETALLFGVLRTTTVTTNAKCLMLAISKKNYDQLVPEVATLFEEEARRRCVGKLGKMSKTVPFLAEIDSDIFLERGEIITIDNDTRVFEKGSIGDCFYIILFGEVGVIGDAECEPIHAEDDGTAPHEPSPTAVHHYDPSLEEAFLTLRTGQYFGEMALMTDETAPRTCTVTSVCRTILLKITKADFEHIFDDVPEALDEFKLRTLKHRAPLAAVLHKEAGVDAMRKFADARDEPHIVVSINFWCAVEERRAAMKKAAGSAGAEKGKTAAAEIRETFFSSTSPPGLGGLLQVHEAATAGCSGASEDAPEYFDAAQRAVYTALAAPSFCTPFKSSPQFKTFMEQIGVGFEAPSKSDETMPVEELSATF